MAVPIVPIITRQISSVDVKKKKRVLSIFLEMFLLDLYLKLVGFAELLQGPEVNQRSNLFL